MFEVVFLNEQGNRVTKVFYNERQAWIFITKAKKSRRITLVSWNKVY